MTALSNSTPIVVFGQSGLAIQIQDGPMSVSFFVHKNSQISWYISAAYLAPVSRLRQKIHYIKSVFKNLTFNDLFLDNSINS